MKAFSRMLFLLVGGAILASGQEYDCWNVPSYFPENPLYGVTKLWITSGQVHYLSFFDTYGDYQTKCYNHEIDVFLFIDEDWVNYTTLGTPSSSGQAMGSPYGHQVEVSGSVDVQPGKLHTIGTNHWIKAAFAHGSGYSDPFGFSLINIGNILGDPPVSFVGTTSPSRVAETPYWYVGTTWAEEQDTQEVTIGLSTDATPEHDKSGHFLKPICESGSVVITASVSAESPPSWTGGSAGSDAYHRVLSCGTAGDFDVTARIGDVTATVKIHIVDAPVATAYNSTADAPLSQTPVGANSNVSDDEFGHTWVALRSTNDPPPAVPRPSINIEAQIDGDKWAFRVVSIDHTYKIGVKEPQISGRSFFDLNESNVNPTPDTSFPRPFSNMTVTQAHTQARADFVIPATGSGQGPPRYMYWSSTVTMHHEEAHARQFYDTGSGFDFWPQYMRIFEILDVEHVINELFYDCGASATSVASSVLAAKDFSGLVAYEHTAAVNELFSTVNPEVYAYNTTNGEYTTLRNLIPNP